MQAQLPIWIGGGGERKTLRTVAKWADGWNVPFVSPDEFARKRQVLLRHCEDVGRDPSEIKCAVNVALAWKDEDLVVQFNGLADFFRDAALTGSDEEARDKVGRYIDAGADQLKKLEAAAAEADKRYSTAATKLSAARGKSAEKLNKAVNAELAPLKLERPTRAPRGPRAA